MIEVYAITDDPTPPPPPLRAVPCDELTTICGPAEAREVTPDALWRYEELVERLMAERDLLPMRYGTVLADEDAVVRAVTERKAELLAALERVRGAVEVAVQTRAPEGESPPPTSGKDYMRAKARSLEAVRRVHEPLAALARDTVAAARGEPPRVAYLVDRDEVEAFVSEVSRLQAGQADVQVLCTGPWPPYSFVER